MFCTVSPVVHSVSPVLAGETAEALENLERLKQTKSCKGCNLSGLTMNRLDLADADLEGADLSSSKLSLTNLTRANLRNTDLRGTIFGGADLSDADLRGADLRGTSLDSSYHQGAQFDGEFVATKPYEDDSVSEVEKEVFVADTAKPKQSPETTDVKLGDPPEIAKTPPPEKGEEKPAAIVERNDEASKDAVLVSGVAPAAKKLAPVQQAIVETPAPEEKTAEVKIVPSVQGKKEEPKVLATPEVISGKKPAVNVPEKTVKPLAAAQVETEKEKQDAAEPAVLKKIAQPSQPKAEEKPAILSRVGSLSQDPAAVKAKEENLKMLLDTSRCFGCDLSGLDLSGKNLSGADLEKANLSGCNLEKIDLDKANLKGAQFVKANMRRASVQKADFYKADLSGADLTEAKVKEAMFDNAKIETAIGLNEAMKVSAE